MSGIFDSLARQPFEHIAECPVSNQPDAECRCEVGGIFCRCLVCRVAFTKAEVWGKDECPECKTKFKPMYEVQGKSAVNIAWMELQTLACWAEQFAAMYSEQCPDMKAAVYAITHELELQHPMNSPLTLGRELGVLKQKSPLVTKVGNVDPIDPKFRLQ